MSSRTRRAGNFFFLDSDSRENLVLGCGAAQFEGYEVNKLGSNIHSICPVIVTTALSYCQYKPVDVINLSSFDNNAVYR